MMPNAWFFGDSFTYCDGLHDGDEFPTKFPHLIDKFWTEHLCDEFNWNHNNMGIPGASSQKILTNLIHHLHKVKKGDIVFISDTLPTRLESIQLYKSEEGLSPIVTSITSENLVYDNLEPEVVLKLEKNDMPTMVNYVYQFLAKHDKVWELYWVRVFQDFMKVFESMGVECYFWTHRIWSTKIDNFRYSTIPQESNGECSNIHWGWKGNKQFYEYLRLRVKDKKYFSPSEFYGLKKIYEPESVL